MVVQTEAGYKLNFSVHPTLRPLHLLHPTLRLPHLLRRLRPVPCLPAAAHGC